MNADFFSFWALFAIIVIIAVSAAAILAVAIREGASREGASREGASRSKLEARIIATLEEITGLNFDQARPDWLRDPKSRASLELDGYNASAKIAVEVQGPQHWKPAYGEKYAEYKKRITRDAYKQKICAEHGVTLIVVDYQISQGAIRDYLRSRLYDAKFEKDGAPIEKPYNYLPPAIPTAWERGGL